jgi:hypothetical protein
MRSTVVFILLALVSPTAARAQFLQRLAPQEDPTALINAAKETAEKLKTSPASWKITLASTPDVSYIADVVQQSQNLRRIIFRSNDKDRGEAEMARLIETPDAWYVAQGGAFYKYRPYEAVFYSPVIQLLHQLAQPRLILDVDPKILAKPLGREGNIVRFALPAPNPALLKGLLDQVEQLRKIDPERVSKDPMVLRTVAETRRALEQGIPVGVDARSGIIVAFTADKSPVTLTDFKRYRAIPDEPFSVKEQAWRDVTDDPTEGKLESLVLMAHDPSWRDGPWPMLNWPPGTPTRKTECVLVDVSTGRVRRLAVRRAGAVPGCFINHRTGALAWAVDTDGLTHLHQVDLKTGANVELAAETLADGLLLAAAPAPDGKTVAFLHKRISYSILDSQILLLDLQSGKIRPLGATAPVSDLNWLPDGSALICVKREFPDPKSDPVDSICRVDLATGNLTTVTQGRRALVLPNSKSMLYYQPDLRGWMTADLEGKRPKPMNAALGRYDFPTAAPDGQHLLMLSLDDDKGPWPTLIEPQTGQTQSLTLPPGLWALPAWR